VQLRADDLRRHHAGDRQKNAAMAEMKPSPTSHLLLAARGNAAITRDDPRGNAAIRYAEAFQRVTPQVVTSL
jgi:hypothetical protein